MRDKGALRSRRPATEARRLRSADGALSAFLLILLPFLASWECGGAVAVSVADDRDTHSVAFTDVTALVGLHEFRHVTGAVGNYWMPETMGGGGGFLDYDGDGWIDIVLVRGIGWDDTEGSAESAVVLYRNMGDGTFEERTAEAGLDSVFTYAFGVTVADYDNDGDEDIYLTSLNRNLLFRNDGGVFSEVGNFAGVAGPDEWSTAAVFFDAEGDGALDLFVGNYVIWSPESDMPCMLAGGLRSYCTPDTYTGLPGRFYRNRGDGTFEEQTESAGFGGDVPGKTLAAVSIDYDGDGRMDLIVVNDTERDLLYRNLGGGTFEEIGIMSGLAFDQNGRARAGMGVDVGVMDSTGRPTVFVSNFARERVGEYHYAGNGRFVDRAQQTNIGQSSANLLSFGVVVFDADLDGHSDVFTANGHINPEIEEVDGTIPYRQPPRVYRNRGDGTYEVVDGADSGTVPDTPMVARGLAYGDYDRDGDVDLLIVENGGPVHLWRNDVKDRSFVRIRLDGRRSNRSGIGARVDLAADSARASQYVRAGSSYLSASESVLTFGLGEASSVDTLVVKWPSGHVDTLEHVPANSEIVVTESSGYRIVGGAESQMQAAAEIR